MRHRAVILLTILLATLFLTGCWNRREIEALGFVMAVGVDQRENGQTEVTVQVAKPEALGKRDGGGKAVKAFTTYSASGRIIAEAVGNLGKESPRSLWFGHNQVVIIGEEMARRGVLPVMDWLAREPELRREMWVLVARGKAKDLLEAEVEFERIPAKGILRLIKARGVASLAQAIRANEFLRVLSTKHTSVTTSVITISNEPKGGEKLTPEFRLEGAAVFRGSTLVGFLDAIETRGMLWVTGKLRRGIVVVPYPEDENERVALEIVRASGEIEPRTEDGRISFVVKIRAEGAIGEQTSSANLATPFALEELERRERQVIEEEIAAALRRAKELKADIFGFGETLHREFPSLWRELKEEWVSEGFPEIALIPEIKTVLRRTGKSRPTLPREKGTR
jgi:spore germination protein KC